MKNIHLIPTDKPSRLFLKENMLLFNNQYTLQEVFPKGKCQHIYITSDEEIRDCWAFNTHINQAYFMKGFYGKQPKAKKIILTTDQDLIKDDVQAIDDEFLEWFVKNPSCELVPIANEWKEKYKIIIPQQMTECYFTPNTTTSSATICVYCGKEKFLHTIGKGIEFSKSVTITEEESKQETLEEAIKRLVKLNRQDAFREGAKWQAERMYSEEEVLKAQQAILSNIRHAMDDDNYIIEYLEQFKKK